jgi:hypothetical protein
MENAVCVLTEAWLGGYNRERPPITKVSLHRNRSKETALTHRSIRYEVNSIIQFSQSPT